MQGGGLVHSTHVNIEAETLIVDDLGVIKGDLHTITCSQGSGYDGTVGSGMGSFIAVLSSTEYNVYTHKNHI